jgi:CTP:molybdopterin cytidylyltransferase MocA
MTIAALVLAAGGGSRYVGPTHKLLAPYRGRPLVATALDAVAAASFDEMAVVAGAIDFVDVVPAGMQVLENPDWASGLSSSLRVGIAWCARQGHDAVVIGLGDTPGVPTSAWEALRLVDADVAVASFGGQLRPPVKLSAARYPDVPTEGDVGARALWHRPGTLEVACDGDPSDIDTLDDLTRLEAAT